MTRPNHADADKDPIANLPPQHKRSRATPKGSNSRIGSEPLFLTSEAFGFATWVPAKQVSPDAK